MAYYWGVDPWLWLVLLAGILGLIGATIGMSFKKFQQQSLSLKESLKSSFGAGILGAIIGLILSLLLSLYPIFTFGFPALLGAAGIFIVFIVGGFALFFFLGFLYYYVNMPIQFKNAIIFGCAGIALGLLLWAVFISTTGPVGSYMSFAMAPIRDKIDNFFTELGKFKFCFYADARCPFFVQWDEPQTTNAEELLNIDVQFSDQKILENEINLLVELNVKNPELTELKIKPKCYLGKTKEEELEIGNLGKYTIGEEFSFPLSSYEMHTSFRCLGDLPPTTNPVYTGKVLVDLERPVSLKGNWPIYIGSEPNMGRAKTIMSFNAPYSIALFSYNDMPFEEGQYYDFSLTIKRLDEDSKLKMIREIRLQFPDSINAECNHFEATGQVLELYNIDAELLKNISYYLKEEDKYTFPCRLYVKSAPQEATLAPINIEASYDVVSEYTTDVLKSHANAGSPEEVISVEQIKSGNIIP